MTEAPKTLKINYQGNSNVDKEAAKAPEKTKPRAKPIEGGIEVVQVKKSLGKRVKESFGGQDLKSVGNFLLMDVVIPSARDLLFDLLQEGGRKAIYGDNARRPGGVIGSAIINNVRPRQTSYNTISSNLSNARRPNDTSVVQSNQNTSDFGGWEVATRAQAEEVIQRMSDVVGEYGQVTVSDFYDIVQVSGNGFTDLQFGWDPSQFSKAEIRKSRNGWIISLPQPVSIS